MEELRRMREQAGLTQVDLAKVSGVDRGTIIKIESGKRSPSIETLEKLARAMGAEIGDFFPKAQPPLPLDPEPAEAERGEGRIVKLSGESISRSEAQGELTIIDKALRELDESLAAVEPRIRQQVEEDIAASIRRKVATLEHA